MLVTASIVVYKTNVFELEKVLKSTISSIVNIIYLVDNSPLNESLDSFRNFSPKICYISNPINTGFGAGHNLAIQRALEINSDYHIVINPDIYFECGVIEKLTLFMNSYEDVGLVMPKVLYPNGELQYLCKLLPTPFDLLGRRFLPCKKYIRYRNERYELRFLGYDKEMEVPSLSGCFMFIRVSVLKQIGGFDERFFMYAEDLDLCRRIGQVSKTMYYPGVCVFHGYAKGSYKNKKLLKYHIGLKVAQWSQSSLTNGSRGVGDDLCHIRSRNLPNALTLGASSLG